MSSEQRGRAPADPGRRMRRRTGGGGAESTTPAWWADRRALLRTHTGPAQDSAVPRLPRLLYHASWGRARGAICRELGPGARWAGTWPGQPPCPGPSWAPSVKLLEREASQPCVAATLPRPPSAPARDLSPSWWERWRHGAGPHPILSVTAQQVSAGQMHWVTEERQVNQGGWRSTVTTPYDAAQLGAEAPAWDPGCRESEPPDSPSSHVISGGLQRGRSLQPQCWALRGYLAAA